MSLSSRLCLAEGDDSSEHVEQMLLAQRSQNQQRTPKNSGSGIVDYKLEEKCYVGGYYVEYFMSMFMPSVRIHCTKYSNLLQSSRSDFLLSKRLF